MSDAAFVAPLFQAIDAMDAPRFVSFLTEDAVFRFANGPEVHGREAIRDAVSGFFGAIAGLKHRVTDTWAHPGAVICRGDVIYTRKDGSELTVPFADVLLLRGTEVADYRIYMDVTQLFAPPGP
jgi:ketosteroid isomerase-like protein